MVGGVLLLFSCCSQNFHKLTEVTMFNQHLSIIKEVKWEVSLPLDKE